MEELKRHDIVASGSVLAVVVECDLLPPDSSIVVIPLIANYPVVTRLNPLIQHEDTTYVLATRLIGSVRRTAVRRVGSASSQGDSITTAIDILTSGF